MIMFLWKFGAIRYIENLKTLYYMTCHPTSLIEHTAVKSAGILNDNILIVQKSSELYLQYIHSLCKHIYIVCNSINRARHLEGGWKAWIKHLLENEI